MTVYEIRYELRRLLWRYRATRILETGILASAAGITAGALASIFSEQTVISATVGILVAIAIAFLRTNQLKIFKVDEYSIVRYVNQQWPSLQESTDLLMRKPEDLTLLQQIQQLRTAKQFNSVRSQIQLPHQLLQATLAFVAGTLIAAVIFLAFGRTANNTSPGVSEKSTPNKAQQVLLTTVAQLQLKVSPPAYTRVPEQTSGTFPIAAPEGSRADWSISFTQNIERAELIFNGRDTVVLRASGSAFTAMKILSASGFYQLSWRTSDGHNRYSDFYPITIRLDASPVLRIDNPGQFLQIDPTSRLLVDMKASLADDYGLADAYIVATVSKGSGEGVKFREERLRFDTPKKIGGKTVGASRRIDLVKLGLEPGDELYYYVEAFDNRLPVANRARTETYFITVKDTAEMTTSVDPGLGVDLMPEYFRSQRQIIIDSEKLLKEKTRISREQFNTRSNALAHDEKVLRLRYGEFLGEEFETSIGPSSAADLHSEHDEDIVKQFGHQHDTDEEHAARVEAPAPSGTSHKHGHTENDPKADPSKAYMHAHDSEEEATFFTQSIRAKLKAAITIMWDAELHLRLYTPEKSLPYQYRALKLLKEISQDSRIYVHRTGFDPPPLREDKRLSGDLDEIRSGITTSASATKEPLPAVRKALALLENTLANHDSVTAPERELLMQAGNELSAVAIRQPSRYLNALSLLRAYAANELRDAERKNAVTVIRAAFYQVLPVATPNPSGRYETTHPLDDAFLRNYDELKGPAR